MSKRKYSVVERTGTKIILPEGMSYKDARATLRDIEVDEETVVSVSESFSAYPSEGAYAFASALDEVFGFFRQIGSPGGFFTPGKAPEMKTIPISVDEKTEVPWGRMVIPGIDGYLETGFSIVRGRVVFQVSGKVKKRDRPKVLQLMEVTARNISERSIYRGKAIRLTFPDFTDDGFNPMEDVPQFVDTRGFDEGDLILNRSVEDQIRSGLWAPIMYREASRRAGVPFKRGVCLEGTYGVGKSLTARVTATICERHGITFLHLVKASDLKEAIEFARAYSPAVIFAEDVDRITNGTRDEAMDDLLNTIDGIGSKGAEVMVVLTTNHVESIHEAMLRPGRLDQVIHMAEPDAEAVQRLIRLFGAGLIDGDSDLEGVSEMLAGQIPAVIREVVERSKLAAIMRAGGSFKALRTEDLKIAAEGLLEQRRRLAREKGDAADLLLTRVAKSVGQGFATTVREAHNEALRLTGEV